MGITTTPTQQPKHGGGFLTPPSTPVTQTPTYTGTNTAQNNPDLSYLLNKVRDRIDGDMGQDKATVAAGQRIGEFAQGQQSRVRGSLAQRGMLGNSGSEGELGSEIGVAAGAQFAQQASQIAQDAERRRDAMMMGSGGIFAEPGRQNIADRSLGLNQWQAQSNAELQRAQMEQQAKLQQEALAAQQQQQNFQNQLSSQELALRQQQAMWNNFGGVSGSSGGSRTVATAPRQVSRFG
jgi:hypothetical protein